MLQNIIVAFAIAAMVLVGSVEGVAQEKARLGREAITAMFDAARKTSTWSIDGKCQWGYFFFDPDRQKLQSAGKSSGKRAIVLSGSGGP